MRDFLLRLRQLWALSARANDPSSLDRLIKIGVVEIGEHTYGEPRVVVWFSSVGEPYGGSVQIGRYCAIAPGVTILTGGNHRTDWVSCYPLRARLDLPGRDADGAVTSKGDVLIGHDVWIGEGASILAGVTIGHGAVIGAYAVVARDVAPYSVVVGNTARVVRRRFTDEQIDSLLRIAWWDWPQDKVLECVNDLNGATIEAFLSTHGG